MPRSVALALVLATSLALAGCNTFRETGEPPDDTTTPDTSVAGDTSGDLADVESDTEPPLDLSGDADTEVAVDVDAEVTADTADTTAPDLATDTDATELGELCGTMRCAPHELCCSDAGEPACIDPMTDGLNCGACGTACTGPDACNAGACSLGTWHLSTVTWLTPTQMATFSGEVVFAPDRSFDLDGITSGSGLALSNSGTLELESDGTVAVQETAATFVGQLAQRADLMLTVDEAVEGSRLQSIWVRRTTGHRIEDLQGEWALGSYLDQGEANASVPSSLYGSVGILGQEAGVDAFETAFNQDSSLQATVSVTDDGQVTFDLTGSEETWRGQVNAFDDVMVLQTAPDGVFGDGFRAGHVVLVKKPASVDPATTVASWVVSVLADEYRAARGELSLSSTDFDAGELSWSDGSQNTVCNGGTVEPHPDQDELQLVFTHGGTCMVQTALRGWPGGFDAGQATVMLARTNNNAAASLHLWLRRP